MYNIYSVALGYLGNYGQLKKPHTENMGIFFLAKSAYIMVKKENYSIVCLEPSN